MANNSQTTGSANDPYSVESLIRETREMCSEIELNRAIIRQETDKYLSQLVANNLSIQRASRPRPNILIFICRNRRTGETLRVTSDEFHLMTWNSDWSFQTENDQ
jgi:hypothetical protein